MRFKGAPAALQTRRFERTLNHEKRRDVAGVGRRLHSENGYANSYGAGIGPRSASRLVQRPSGLGLYIMDEAATSHSSFDIIANGSSRGALR